VEEEGTHALEVEAQADAAEAPQDKAEEGVEVYSIDLLSLYFGNKRVIFTHFAQDMNVKFVLEFM
jgi:hypothetical protein